MTTVFRPLRNLQVEVRSVVEQDRQRLANLVHFEMYVHRHLDWQSPLDWLGRRPFLLAEQQGALLGALSCPIDPPEVAWLRLFAATNQSPVQHVWDALWAQARQELTQMNLGVVAAIPLQSWLIDLLVNSGFQHVNDVIVLSWQSGMSAPDPALQWPGLRIRLMTPADLDRVGAVDAAAFQPLWQNSCESLEQALAQAAVATVAEDSSGIVGYQLSTSSHQGGHIARLAVHPGAQGRNLGYALIYDVLRQFEKRSIYRATVNTQRDNVISQSLYHKAGFYKTGESYPVYQLNLGVESPA